MWLQPSPPPPLAKTEKCQPPCISLNLSSLYVEGRGLSLLSKRIEKIYFSFCSRQLNE
jgi:hypothetical protein